MRAAAALAIAAVALFSRQPERLLHPELWAEDGTVWIYEAHVNGAASLLTAHSGYLQTLPRLCALISLALPLTAAPLLFALAAFCVQLAPVGLLLSSRGSRLVPSLPARLLLALYYIGTPGLNEIFLNLTNAMWYLAVSALLIMLLPKPRTAAFCALDVAILLLSGLSGPFALVLAPMAWLHAGAGCHEAEAKLRALYAGVLTLCAFVQAACLFFLGGVQRQTHLGATFSRSLHIIAAQVFLGFATGTQPVKTLLAAPWWLGVTPAAVVCALGFAIGAAAFIKGPPAHRYLVMFAGLVVLGGLASPEVSDHAPQWAVMQQPGAGGRYFCFAILAWFSSFLVLAGQDGAPAWAWTGRIMVLACTIGAALGWHHSRYMHTAYHKDAARFDHAAPGTTMTFPENPPPWNFTLTEQP